MDRLDKCMLCPRECGVSRSSGETGFCRSDSRIKIARAALHFGEEPCISGTRGSGTVFFSGCNLRCIFCQNYKISEQCVGKYVTEEELSDIFLGLEQKGAHNINLVTAVHFIPRVIEALRLAKNRGLSIPVVYNSGGYESVSALRMLEGYIDIYLPDFKYYDNKYALGYSSAPDYCQRAQEAISEMVRQTGRAEFDKDGIMKKGVIVRHLMLPGLLFDSKKIIDYLYNTYHNDIWISIMNQYTPLKQVQKINRLNRPLNKKHYEALLNYAVRLGVENAFVQEDGSAGEEYIPEFYGDDKDF